MVKRLLFACVLVLFLVSFVAAAPDLNVETEDKGTVVIAQLNNPAIFDFKIFNGGPSEQFELYSLVGVSMRPKTPFILETGDNFLEVRAYPGDFVRSHRGLFIFDYQLQGENSGIFEDQLLIKIVDLEDVLEISADNIAPSDSKIRVYLNNVENTHLNDVSINFKSEFFDFTEIITLEPFGNESFEVNFDSDQFRRVEAGPYVITASIELEGAKTKVDGIISYLEREGIAVEKDDSGFFLRKNTVTKTNVGNTPTMVEIEVKRDVFRRLFTGHSIAPLSSDREGVSVNYVWAQELQPGESYSITTTTNYTFPFILLVLIILIGLMVQSTGRTTVVLTKRVSYVKTKNDDFALKVRLHVKARRGVSNVEIVDRIPPTMRLYSGFGRRPDRVQEGSGRIEWDLGSLTSGEERVISYVIYSKIRVLGRFELSPAVVLFEEGDRKERVVSNRTSFAMETSESKPSE